MPIDLSNHKWPVRDKGVPSKPGGGELIGSAYKTFVSEGALYVRNIDFNGQMRAIPRECSAITAMGHENGVIYGATRGEQSWLFQYALLSYHEAAVPLCPIPDCTDVRGMAVIAGHAYAGANEAQEGRIVKVSGLKLPGDVIQEWSMPRPRFETLSTPVPGERIAVLIGSRDGETIYGLTSPGGVLFGFQLEDSELTVFGPVDGAGFFGEALVEDNAGYVYAFGSVGKMVCYNPFTEKIDETGTHVPIFPGRGPYARISAAVYDGSLERIYVGDTEGLISVVSLADNTVITLGKPVPLGGIDHMVCLGDGRIFGWPAGAMGCRISSCTNRARAVCGTWVCAARLSRRAGTVTALEQCWQRPKAE